jgi:hypothetical protein
MVRFEQAGRRRVKISDQKQIDTNNMFQIQRRTSASSDARGGTNAAEKHDSIGFGRVCEGIHSLFIVHASKRGTCADKMAYRRNRDG